MSITARKQTVTVRTKAGLDGEARPMLSDPVAYRVRVVEEAKLVRDEKGDEIASRFSVTFDKLPTVEIGDEITYTDENAKTYVLEAIQRNVSRWPSGKPIETMVYCS